MTLLNMYLSRYLFNFFFFQAEDGIRDYKVTGVQTCALPISWWGAARRPAPLECSGPTPPSARPAPRPRGRRPDRSEERRVGKEWRSRRARYQYKNKKKKTG